MSIGPVVKEALTLLRSTLPSTIIFHEEIDENCGTSLGDATEMHQIVMNLCTNAFHAMQERGGTLSVSLKRLGQPPPRKLAGARLEPGKCVCLEVSDTGHGMDAKTMERIFDPYFTTKEVGQGTGLGLSTVLGIVKRYGGDMVVRSAPDRGSTFSIYLPLESDQTVVPEGPPARATPKYLGCERILFIDDEAPIVHVSKQALGLMGYSVEGYTDSEEALGAFRSDPQRFDLVITDQTMPKLTGLDLAREVQRIRRGTPVILCSGFSEAIYEQNVGSLGVAAYLPKPFLPLDIAATIRRVMDGLEAAAAAGP
jgi:CheY-like chemotaxis protein